MNEKASWGFMIGFVLSWAIFTTILYLIISWKFELGITHALIISSCVVILGVLLGRWLS